MLFPLLSFLEYDLSFTFHKQNVGLDNSVGIASGYGLDGPGIQSLGGARDFPHPSWPALGPTVEQLINIAAVRNIKDTFKRATLFEFWSLCISEYPESAKRIVQHLLPIVSSYRCEAPFQNWPSPRRSKETGVIL